jgi:hypothetical protein
VVATACGSAPEQQLLGCWTETEWSYERADDNGNGKSPNARSRWGDGIRLHAYPDRQVIRHEAEVWEFRPHGELHMRRLDGAIGHAKWRLKGRGHVLTIWHDEEHFEVYDIKELSRDELILHFDMGMEVRGIARLEFARTTCDAMQAARSSTAEQDLALASQPRPGNAS